jgi:FAD/FMN-containing dehydrogenase
MPFIDALAAIVGQPGLVTDPAALQSHNTDWRGRYHGDATLVVKPGSTAEVAAVVKACREARVAIVPQGGNTSLCGAAIPRPGMGDIILSLSRLNRMREIDWENETLTCEAGMTLAAVQEAAQQGGRLFPLSLASEGSAEIGGLISTNAGGTAVLRYGNMRSLVLGLEAVLPDGRIWNGLRSLRKDNTGYDIKQWFIGAEGTLGIITAAVLRLFLRPQKRVTAWIAVSSPQDAVRLLSLLRERCGERVSAFELVSRPALELVLKHVPGKQDPLTKAFPWAVLAELDDADPSAPLEARLEEALEEGLERGALCDAVIAHSDAQAQALWMLREQIAEAQRLEGLSIKHDISVPVSRIPRFIAEATTRLEAAFPGIRLICFGHVGDGNLHFNLSKPGPQDNAAFIGQTASVNRIVHDTVVEMGGSISAEHGIGQLKVEELARYRDAVDLDLMKALKQALDPEGLMNPGKILPATR